MTAQAEKGGAYLEISGISRSFAGKPALRGVSLGLAPGEFTVILGPSGCGKSTLLNIIAGIIAPDAGNIRFAGADITHLPMERRNMGMVFQNYALFPNLSVFENVAYGLRALRLPRAEADRRAAEMLALVRMPELAKSLPAELSGGQQQRVALARALATRPALLLLDEPLSALDAQVRAALGRELLQIQRETGVTAIMVTHDQEEALALADRVVLIREGGVEQDGSPEAIYSRPVSRFAAEFIGHTNFVDMSGLNAGKPFGVRYEDVLVREATESTLAEAHTWVGKVTRSTLMGAFVRQELLLSDHSTRLFADIAWNSEVGRSGPGRLVAVSLPEASWMRWEV